MTEPTNGRFLSATSQALLYIVAAAVCLVALASFALSFNALAELAIACHIPVFIGWAWPVVVDASIIIATFASLVLRGRSSRSVRAYPWLILIVFGAVSVAGNGYHALTGGAAPVPAVAFTVGAVPAVALLASTHLLVVMLTSPHHTETDEEIERRLQRQRKAAQKSAAEPRETTTPTPAAPEVAAAPASASRSAAVTPPARKPAAQLTRDQAIAHVLAHHRSSGEWLSGPAVGDLMGATRKTGARVVAAAKESAGA